MTPAELIEAAMKKTDTPSIRKLADQIGVDHSMVIRWAKEERPIQFEDAAVLAEMAGLPPIRTAAEVRLPHAAGKKLSSLLRRLSRVAAIGAAIFALPHFAHAKMHTNSQSEKIEFYIKQTYYTFTLETLGN